MTREQKIQNMFRNAGMDEPYIDISIEKGSIGKAGYGLAHIIEKRIKNKKRRNLLLYVELVSSSGKKSSCLYNIKGKYLKQT